MVSSSQVRRQHRMIWRTRLAPVRERLAGVSETSQKRINSVFGGAIDEAPQPR